MNLQQLQSLSASSTPLNSQVAGNSGYTHQLSRWFVVAGLVLGFFLPSFCLAQASPGARAKPLEVRDLKIKEVTTPSYTVSSDSDRGKRKSINKWLEVRSEYRVSREWVDSAQFKYYIAMEAKDAKHLPADARRPINILTGDVTYEDIPQGASHLSTMYLTPTKFFRFGKVIGFRVEVLVGGQTVEMKERVDARLKASPDWHKKPGKRILLNRSQTPFSPIDRDSFNDIKVEAGR